MAYVYKLLSLEVVHVLEYISWDRLKEFENWVQRKVFCPKRDEVTGEWRRLYNEALNDPYQTLFG